MRDTEVQAQETAVSNPHRNFKSKKIAACSAFKRVGPDALEATVTTVTIPGHDVPYDIFVLTDGTRLFTSGHTIIQLVPSDRMSTITGNPLEVNTTDDLTVDRTDNVVVADFGNHVIRSVTKGGHIRQHTG